MDPGRHIDDENALSVRVLSLQLVHNLGELARLSEAGASRPAEHEDLARRLADDLAGAYGAMLVLANRLGVDLGDALLPPTGATDRPS